MHPSLPTLVAGEGSRKLGIASATPTVWVAAPAPPLSNPGSGPEGRGSCFVGTFYSAVNMDRAQLVLIVTEISGDFIRCRDS